LKSRSESLIRLKKFQVDEKRRQVSQIEMMVNDFERMASELDQQIEIEHTKTGISDVAHFAYSTFAKGPLANPPRPRVIRPRFSQNCHDCWNGRVLGRLLPVPLPVSLPF